MDAVSLNLLTAPWLPVFRRSGKADIIRPAQIADSDDPVTDIAWPRPDFRLAAIEFLIGCLATFAPPENETAWRAGWQAAPSVTALDDAFAPYAHAFSLDGDGPRFMQDYDGMPDAGATEIGALLIEAPGVRTEKNNADLMVKRRRVTRLSRPAAAMALFTLQIYAPTGGAGHRVGLRGAGPLTTLALPDDGHDRPSLWHFVWANVPTGCRALTATLSRVLPWLAPTPTSEANRTAFAAGLEPLHVFWSMPRRIRLEVAANAEKLSCDLTGQIDHLTVASFRRRPHGLYYDGWLPPHPLSPHRRHKNTGPWLPVHGQPNGFNYNDWVGVVIADRDDIRTPSQCISTARTTRGSALGNAPRFFAGGYDMDDAKARGFVEVEMALPKRLGDEAASAAYDDAIRRLVQGANFATEATRAAVRSALLSPNAKIDVAGATLVGGIRERFWRATEASFHGRLGPLADAVSKDPATPVAPLLKPWLDVLRQAALRCFDEAAPLDPDAYRETQDQGQRIVAARRALGRTFAGHGAGGKRLFEVLCQPLPEPPQTRRGTCS